MIRGCICGGADVCGLDTAGVDGCGLCLGSLDCSAKDEAGGCTPFLIPHMTSSCMGAPVHLSTPHLVLHLTGSDPAHDFVMYGAPVIHLSTLGPVRRCTLLPCRTGLSGISVRVMFTWSRLAVMAAVRISPRAMLTGRLSRCWNGCVPGHGLMVFGYVLMPEHVHLLVSEPPVTRLDAVLKAVKQESAKKLRQLGRKHFWEERYHDFNVFSEAKFKEKLRYIHRNPVKRGLVTKPEEWRWSSFCHYQTGLPGTIEVESWWTEQARTRLREIDPGGGESRT